MLSDLIKKLSPKHPLQSLFDAGNTLATLGDTLETIEVKLTHDPQSAVELIVDFFDAVSKAQDTLPLDDILVAVTEADRRAKGKYVRTLGNLHTLRIHLTRAGRDSYGMNRTKRGQRVTANDVYLGNVSGYITKTAAYVNGQRHQDPGFFRACTHQATRFMRSHFDIIDLCKALVEVTAR